MADVFISYAREDRDLVKGLADELSALKLTVWLDAKATSGKAFGKEIDRELEIARCVLVCWSPDSVESQWVIAEAEDGRVRNVLAAAWLRGDDLRVPKPFNLMQVVDLRLWSRPEHEHPGWRILIKRIGELTARADLATWAELDQEGPATRLEQWLSRYGSSSPLTPSVTAWFERRQKIEFEHRIEEEKRARELAEGRKADAEALANATREKEEAQKAQREQEDELARIRIRYEESARQAADERLRQSETERRVAEERMQRDVEALQEQERLARIEKERVAALEKSARTIKEIIDRKEKAVAEERRLKAQLEQINARQASKSDSSSHQTAAPRKVETAESLQQSRRRAAGDAPWKRLAIRTVGSLIAVGAIAGILVATTPSARSSVGGVLNNFGIHNPIAPGPTAASAEPGVIVPIADFTPPRPMAAGRDGANVRAAPADPSILLRLSAGADLQITGTAETAGHKWYRVVLPDQRIGFVRDDVIVQSTRVASAAAPASIPHVDSYLPQRPLATGPDGANVRTTPRRDGTVLVRLEAGEVLSINGRVIVDGRRWYRIVLADDRVGFVREDVVERPQQLAQISAAVPTTAIEDYTPLAPMVAGMDGANVRREAGTSSPLLTHLAAGAQLRITGRTGAQNGREWYRVVLPDARTGFVRSDVIEVSASAPAPAQLNRAPLTWIDLSKVTWLHRATQTEMDAAYPRQALRRGDRGQVEVQCLVRPNGRMDDCSVALADPDEPDFSPAALRVARSLRIDPTLQDRTQAGGRWLRVQIVFQPPSSAER